MVKLHKEQFGRGPAGARADFAGADALVCVLHRALLPAERKMVETGDENRVRETRVAFQAPTQDEFIGTVERIVLRKVVAFASGVDPHAGVVFETFSFEPQASSDGRHDMPAAEHAREWRDERQAGV